MPTIRKRNGRLQVIVRLKGYAPEYKLMPKGITAKDAMEWGRERERELKTNTVYSETPTLQRELLKNWTLGQLIEDYLAQIIVSEAHELASLFNKELSGVRYVYGSRPLKRSWKNEDIALRSFLKKEKILCDKPLDQVTTKDFQDYVNRRLKTVTAATLRRELNPIRFIWKRGGKFHSLPVKDIFSDLDMPRQSADNSRERPLKPQECPGLFKAIEGCRGLKQQRLWTIFVIVALGTAARRGDLLKVTWRNIDLQERTMFFPGLITKSGKPRRLPLTGDLAFKLGIYRNTLSDAARAPNARVFPISASASEQAWTRIVRRTRLSEYPLWLAPQHPDNLKIHDLRHTAITRFERILTRSESEYMSGHRGAGVHDRYLHPDMEDIRKKLEAADDLFETAAETITSLEDKAFYGRFNIDRMLENDISEDDFTPTPLPDVDWIKRDGHIIMDMAGPKTKAYLNRHVVRDLMEKRFRDTEKQVEKELNEERRSRLSKEGAG
jgi:integrase